MKPLHTFDDLLKYKKLLLAGLDYYIKLYGVLLKHEQDKKSKAFCKVVIKHYQGLKHEVTELYEAGKLSTLKRWFKDISEQAVESRDLNYQNYLKNATGYDINILARFFARIEKIIQSGVITTDNQYRDAAAMANFLNEGTDQSAKLKKLDKLMFSYSDKKRARAKSK